MDQRAISGLSIGAVLGTVGAILYFAVTATVEGFDVNTAGAILMIVGFTTALVAVLWGLTMGMRPNRTHIVERTRVQQTAPPPAQPVVEERPPQRVVAETQTRPAPPPVDQT